MWAAFAARLKEELQFVAVIKLARKTEYDLKKGACEIFQTQPLI